MLVVFLLSRDFFGGATGDNRLVVVLVEMFLQVSFGLANQFAHLGFVLAFHFLGFH